MGVKLKYLFILLVIASGVFSFFAQKKRGNVGQEDRLFAVNDPSKIDRIKIEDNSGRKVLLQRQGSTWLVNEKFLMSDQKKIEMEQVISGLKVHHRLPKEVKQEVLKSLKSNYVRVTYFKGTQKELCFKISTQNKWDSTGTIGLKEGANLPFILGVLAQKTMVQELLLPQEQAWRSLEVLGPLNHEITEVNHVYPLRQEDSFKAFLSNGKLSIVNDKGQNYELDNAKSKQYLEGLKTMEAKSIVMGDSLRRIISNQKKIFFSMELILNDKKWLLKGYQKEATEGQVNFAGEKLKIDNEYFYLSDGSELYLMDYFSFDPILVTYQDFVND